MPYPEFVSGLLWLIYLVLTSSRPNFLVLGWHQSWALYVDLTVLSVMGRGIVDREQSRISARDKPASNIHVHARCTEYTQCKLDNFPSFHATREFSPALLLFAEIRDLVRSPHWNQGKAQR